MAVWITEYYPENGVENINVAIQKLLKHDNQYEGELDGILGRQSYAAIVDLLKSYGINTKGWSKQRLKNAATQAVFKSVGIDPGPVDGYEGPLFRHARNVYIAKVIANFRDEKDKHDEEVPPTTTPVKIKNPETIKQWPRQSECMSFYGKPGTNQTKCILPYPMVLEWDNKVKIKSFDCHVKVKDSMERIWQKVLDAYGYEKIRELRLDQWAGCLNVRKMRGGSSWSMHSWGIAVDMDSDNNQLRWTKDRSEFAKPAYKKYWECVYSEGAISLGIERNFDWMHFQFARL